MYKKDVSVQLGLECISSIFFFKTNEISVRYKIPTYTVGFQGCAHGSNAQPTVGLRHDFHWDLSFFLSFAANLLKPNFIIGLNGWGGPNSSRRTPGPTRL